MALKSGAPALFSHHSLDCRVVLLCILPRERQERDIGRSLPGPCWPRLFEGRDGVDLASPPAALKGASAQERGRLQSGQGTQACTPPSGAPTFKGPWELSNLIVRLE